MTQRLRRATRDGPAGKAERLLFPGKAIKGGALVEHFEGSQADFWR